LFAQAGVVVEFSVVDKGQIAIGNPHGLGAAGQIDDAEARVGEAARAVDEDAIGIGAATAQRNGHPSQQIVRSFFCAKPARIPRCRTCEFLDRRP